MRPLFRPSTVTDTLLRVTRYLYNSLNRVTSLYEGYTKVNDVDQYDRLTTYLYDADGNLEDTTTGLSTNYQPAAQRTTYSYDQLGRRTGVTEAAGTPSARSSVTTYDAADNVIR